MKRIDIELLSEFNSGDRLLVKIITENGIVSSINYVIWADKNETNRREKRHSFKR